MVCYSAPEWFPSLYVSCKQKSSTKLALLYQGMAKIKLGGFDGTIVSLLGRSPPLRLSCASQEAPSHPPEDTHWSSMETEVHSSTIPRVDVHTCAVFDIFRIKML